MAEKTKKGEESEISAEEIKDLDDYVKYMKTEDKELTDAVQQAFNQIHDAGPAGGNVKFMFDTIVENIRPLLEEKALEQMTTETVIDHIQIYLSTITEGLTEESPLEEVLRRVDEKSKEISDIINRTHNPSERSSTAGKMLKKILDSDAVKKDKSLSAERKFFNQDKD